jgi:hypothetical protein
MPAPNWYHPQDYADIQRLRSVSKRARWTFTELFCAELGTKTGLVEVRPAMTAEESDMTPAEVRADIAELAAAGIIVYDAANRLAYHVGSLIRHGPGGNDKHRKGWQTQLLAMPTGCATIAALNELDGIAYGEATDSLSIGYLGQSLQEQEQEQEQEPEQDKELEHAATPPPATQSKFNLEAGERKAKETPEQLIAEYHRICTGLPKIRFNANNPTGKQIIRAIATDSLATWTERFELAAKNPHWQGQNERGWRATLEFLTRPAVIGRFDAGEFATVKPHNPNTPDPNAWRIGMEAKS